MTQLSFFRHHDGTVYSVQHSHPFSDADLDALKWILDGSEPVREDSLGGYYVGPRPEMITPWSTNATEILQTAGIEGVERLEFFHPAEEDTLYDPMLLHKYKGLDATIFDLKTTVEPIRYVEDPAAYNESEGLALSEEEIEYLKGVSQELGRPLTESELFGFSQVNSEHCRHKIFGGTFVIDGEEKDRSLFRMIKDTSAANPNRLVSAYKDNVAFNKGPKVEFFAPEDPTRPSLLGTEEVDSVISLKAETHNFPTTVEPFNGAATGSGGEIRDRLAGGRSSLPLAGTAVYMTSYTRVDAEDRPWESMITARPWLYQSPRQILTKASNGASDFGNKYGQPLICGSVLTFEHSEQDQIWGYDKVIMLAGGIGMARERDALKGHAKPGERVIVIGGDNYRIGMGGGAVSSVNTGVYEDAIELNAVQRSNPEMQKRVSNVIRALAEGRDNPVISIHDHGAGGHLNCLSELVEETGGHIDMSKLPIGDPTLSAKEIIGNESQERMGLLLKEKDVDRVRQIAERERAPFYVVGETTDDMSLVFEQADGAKPFDLKLSHLFGSAPKTVMTDETVDRHFSEPKGDSDVQRLQQLVARVLNLEAVGSKDWLTNKVDRSVTGKVARQQCLGPLQLPLSDLGAVALDYRGECGIATSIGHAPQVALIDPAAGSRVAIAEALTNLLGAPLKGGLEAVSLSANWMWPCRNPGEDAALYTAVEACSDFAIDLGINIPTGKDSLSMTQKYEDGSKVLSPGTVIISAAAELSDVKNIVGPVMCECEGSELIYIDFSFCPASLGGSAYYQTLGKLGEKTPDVTDPEYFVAAFEKVAELVASRKVLAIHDISAGGMVTTLLEMTFANVSGGIEIDLSFSDEEMQKILFAENPGVILQVKDGAEIMKDLERVGIAAARLGKPVTERELVILKDGERISLDIDALREEWYKPSKRMEPFQADAEMAAQRAKNIFRQPLEYNLGEGFTGRGSDYGADPDRQERSGIVAAIIREKGTNGEREMAYALHLAGFDVRDVHMSDLREGREDLKDVRLVVFCGGFSNSDVLGSAKGWAAGFLFNERANKVLKDFYDRTDTLSLGICNGCQLMAALDLIYRDEKGAVKLQHNLSQKFESSFVTLTIPENDSVFLHSLAGRKLGIWVAHGEGRFELSHDLSHYKVGASYLYDEYPGNPNLSPEGVAALYSRDGRHLAMMPHPERCIFPWQCGYYPEGDHEVTPWIELFANAFKWCKTH